MNISSNERLADAIDAALPQTQCTRCGEPDCRRYAEAVAYGRADIDRCPPGGAEGIARLAALTGRPLRPLDPAHGVEGPLRLAVIDEAACIGCTLCIKACPVDCIVGAPKQMHTVIEAECTGCELCLPVCPVDCIALVPQGQATGWAAWSPAQAHAARARYAARNARHARLRHEQDERLAARATQPPASQSGNSPSGSSSSSASTSAAAAPPPADADARRRSVIEAALARARAQRGSA